MRGATTGIFGLNFTMRPRKSIFQYPNQEMFFKYNALDISVNSSSFYGLLMKLSIWQTSENIKTHQQGLN